MAPDSLLAPLTPAELAMLARKLYHGFSRACDAAEDDLHDMDTLRSWSPEYKQRETRAGSLMTVMRELRELHAETLAAARAAAASVTTGSLT